ncbi:M48 family metallopeptidase [Flavilitoribacter nigricans]|uniref:YgjP-like metallopeptidase domain-containing protein n=1 Tax=Flavilitoribacter nigricans (strain ATCC 23147 / DSM 23189 / NBRC 102662 / NCIMB 1420 / SS-2) TaxID=1122177 RepID=A0A2D0MXC2_FLAN2|nr:M48 family metallopeptidase [Flavilitoribacter nigricans]PHN00885.1 hypothetical protein CRP01_40055 [Flavilitoribacter nigricans DSM 23189 = NBRC 102662]
MRRKKSELILIDVAGKRIPLKVVYERRPNIRAAIGKKEVILRIPNNPFSTVNVSQEIDRIKGWLLEVDRKRDGALDRLAIREYIDGQILEVGARQYRLSIREEDRQTHSARLQDGVIELKIARADAGPNLQQNIKTLLSRVIGNDHLPQITRRVHEINDRYFRKPVQSVKLRYNHSRWGSCSTNGNINLSTRLLFAPQPVIDYVIVHELAHMVEMNHSPRFWKVVKDVLPNYKEMEKWLRENSYLCDF